MRGSRVSDSHSEDNGPALDESLITPPISESVLELLRPHLHQRPNAPALVSESGAVLTFAEMGQLLGRTANALRRENLGQSDVVATVFPSGPLAASSFLSVACHAACAPLNPGYSRAEFEFYLDDLEAKALVIPAAYETPAADVAARMGIPVLEATARSSANGDFTISGCGTGDVTRPDPNAIALLLHTSGTTSRPKLVPIRHRNLSASARHITATLRLTQHDRSLIVMPLFHVHGLVAGVVSSLASGGSAVIAPGYRPRPFVDALRDLRVTWYTAAPTVHNAALRSCARVSDADKARWVLRFIRSASAPLPAGTMRALERVFGVPVIEAYGMTEATHQVTSNPLPPAVRKAGSVGLAAGPDVLMTVDEAGATLPSGRVGEVVIRGPNVIDGYVARLQATKSALQNGWFRTGDLGYVDSEGYLFLIGRIKEQINRGGEKVSPREVEDALAGMPGAEELVVFAVPHPTLGEDVACAIVQSSGSSLNEEAVRAYAVDRLASHKIPQRILFVPEIPKGPTRKVQRARLADQLSEYLKAESVPPRSDTEKKLLEIWRRVLGRAGFGVEEDFVALGGDSLLALETIAEAQKHGLRITLPMLARAGTVRELGSLLDSEDSHRSETIIRLRRGPSRILFLFPGAVGSPLHYARAARYLDVDFSLIAFTFPDSGWPAGRMTFRERVLHYVTEIRRLQPRGPYYLLGTSYGGALAFEVAKRLHRGGETVDQLVLLDISAPSLRRHTSKKWLEALLFSRIHDEGALRASVVRAFRRLLTFDRRFALPIPPLNTTSELKRYCSFLFDVPESESDRALDVGVAGFRKLMGDEMWKDWMDRSGVLDRADPEKALQAVLRIWANVRTTSAYRPDWKFPGALHLFLLESEIERGAAGAWQRYSRRQVNVEAVRLPAHGMMFRSHENIASWTPALRNVLASR